MRALHFGAGMAQPGFNVFVTGPQGSGKRTSVRRALVVRKSHAAES